MQWIGGTWWELELLLGWHAVEDDECLTITKSDEGAFQLSSAVKTTGDITMEELREFYEPPVGGGSDFSEIEFGTFRGFCNSYIEDDSYWQKLWLANGNRLLFVSYNGSESAWQLERSEVLAMLSSLRLKQTVPELSA